MNWWGSAYITQVIYAGLAQAGTTDPFAILTESGNPILTESGKDIEIEH